MSTTRRVNVPASSETINYADDFYVLIGDYEANIFTKDKEKRRRIEETIKNEISCQFKKIDKRFANLFSMPMLMAMTKILRMYIESLSTLPILENGIQKAKTMVCTLKRFWLKLKE